MTTLEDKAADPRADRGFLGQPWPLANLFGIEMWERFSFYGMQGILTIYLYYSATRGGLGFSEATATGIVGAYGGAVYLATILGAWLADRVAGPERTLFGAAVVVMLGHVGLALVPGFAGVVVGLVLIALGSGGVKANATSIVGSLYAADDERRDAGFSLFYMGINTGALVGPLLTGLLQDTRGFHWGFGLAAVGMLAGFVQYTLFRGRFPAETRDVPHPLTRRERTTYGVAGAGAAVVVAVLVLTGLLDVDNVADWVIGVTALAALAYFVVILRSPLVDPTERSRVLSFIPLFVANVVFWSLFQQQSTVLSIYSDQRLDRNLLGWTMPVSWVQSINPVFIIVLAGVFAGLWTKLGPRQPSTPVKFGLGTVAMGLAFLLFLLAPAGDNTVPLWLVAIILLGFTVAELLISPVGLSLSTKLAPRSFHTQMVALYFLSVALGTSIAGRLAGYYDANDETGYFLVIGLSAIAAGIVLLLTTRPIRRLMAGVH